MRILYLATSKGIAGSSKALYNLIKGISKWHDVCVVVRENGSFLESIKRAGIDCYSLPHSYLTVYPPSSNIVDKAKLPYRLIKYLFKRYRAYLALLKITRIFKPDIVHTNVGPFDIGFKVAKKLGINHVWHLREYQDLDFGLSVFPNKKSFLKKLSHPCNRSIAITKDVFNYWHLDENRDCVIYDGVFDVIGGYKEELKITKGDYFLFVGRIDDAKGAKFLLKCFALFLKSNNKYRLLLAGRAKKEYLEECRDILINLGIAEKVEFLGERNDVPALMERAIALIVPSRFEGFGFITVEAMYNRCLVIGKNTAGTKEQFDNGLLFTGREIGFRFNDEQELSLLLEKVINLSKSEYEEMAEDAYKTVIHHYQLERHSEEVNMVYTNIYKKNNGFS